MARPTRKAHRPRPRRRPAGVLVVALATVLLSACSGGSDGSVGTGGGSDVDTYPAEAGSLQPACVTATTVLLSGLNAEGSTSFVANGPDPDPLKSGEPGIGQILDTATSGRVLECKMLFHTDAGYAKPIPTGNSISLQIVDDPLYEYPIKVAGSLLTEGSGRTTGGAPYTSGPCPQIEGALGWQNSPICLAGTKASGGSEATWVAYLNVGQGQEDYETLRDSAAVSAIVAKFLDLISFDGTVEPYVG